VLDGQAGIDTVDFSGSPGPIEVVSAGAIVR
jgi:hypothetical protein